jgi:hypothetical protein
VRGLELRFALFLWTAAASSGMEPVRFLYTETPVFQTAPERAAARFPKGARLVIVENGRTRALFPAFQASADACVSPDGTRVLFSGKQKDGDPWQIWEAALSGSAPRRLTRDSRDSITPFYLPAGKVVYSVQTPSGYQIELEPVDLGVAPLRLTYSPGDHVIAGVLRDGRVLFEAPHAAVPGNQRDLYTVYTDGTGVETYRCDHRHDRRGARQLSSGDLLFDTDGRLARFTSPRAVELPVDSPSGQFAGPAAELAGGRLLIAFRPTGGAPFSLYRWAPGDAAPARAIEGRQGASAVQPVLIEERPVPKLHPTALGNREGANLLCLNVYTSREKIARGSVAFVRVWAMDEEGNPVELGKAAVEADGSFYIQAPSERALRFELLGRTGQIVGAEKGWWWARKGEQRVCVGCHAGPERAPENVAPQVLSHTQDPVKLLWPIGQSGRSAK